MMNTSLLPCPFCGAGTTEIMPNGRTWTGMKYGEPTSWSVRHWCAEIPGPSRMIERVGRDKAQAIARWNMRDGKEAAEQAEHRGDMELAVKIRKFQFRDARPNAASEMKLEDAQRLLGHSKEQMTKAVYRRIGEKVRPTK